MEKTVVNHKTDTKSRKVTQKSQRVDKTKYLHIHRKCACVTHSNF